MLWRNLTLAVRLAGLVALVATAACTETKESTGETPPAAKQGDQNVQSEQNVQGEQEEPYKAYRYNSANGGFQVTWPSGCRKLHIKANEPENYVGEEDSRVVLVHVAVCDRVGKVGAGCSVTSTFDARSSDGGEAGPEQVIARVEHALKTYSVKVVRQEQLKREFADGLIVEGVDVFGTGRDGEGEFWVRGLLAYHDIYVLTAWSTEGDLWDNPEYLEFFNDFLPYAE